MPTIATNTTPGLTAELDRARRERDEAAAALEALRDQVDRFRAAVRRRVIEAVNDDTICRPGANEALRDWGMPVLRIAHYATVDIDIELTVTADDDHAAEHAARQTIAEKCAPLSDEEIDETYDIDLDSLRPLEDPPGQPGPTGYQITATLRTRVNVTAEDRDEAADAALDLVYDRLQHIDGVTASHPRCNSSTSPRTPGSTPTPTDTQAHTPAAGPAGHHLSAPAFA